MQDKAPLRGAFFCENARVNVDPAELQKFDQLAHRWWDPAGEFRPLHEINPLRLDWIDRAVSLAGRKVLDVGCGGGILAESMARRGAEVMGIDMADKPLRVAQLHLHESRLPIEYENVSTDALAERCPGRFDVVTCMELLEHVPEPSRMVAACARLARPGGQLFFSTLNRNPKSYVFAVLGAEYILGLLPKGTHDYLRFIKPSELALWCREAGLRVEAMTGMTYNPVSRKYRLVPDCDVNYMVRCVRDR